MAPVPSGPGALCGHPISPSGLHFATPSALAAYIVPLASIQQANLEALLSCPAEAKSTPGPGELDLGKVFCCQGLVSASP